MRIMTSRDSHFSSSGASSDARITKETPEQFLARGGKIQVCPPKVAIGAAMYTPMIAIDEYHVPVAIGSPEYVPNFVKDLSSYTVAQRDSVTNLDDGSVSIIRQDEQHAMHPTVSWRQQSRHAAHREGADIMEVTNEW